MSEDGKPDAVGRIIVSAWGGVLGAFAFLVLVGTSLLDQDWCAGSMFCLREWISALGGWVAAVTAGATIFVLVATLKEMQRSTDHARYLGEIQTQAYVHVSRAEFGQKNNIIIHCKNNGLTPASQFSVNGEVFIVKSGTVANSIQFSDKNFKTWSALGTNEELSVSLDVCSETVQKFCNSPVNTGQLLLVCGQIIYRTMDNHYHLTQFVFFVDKNMKRFRRPTASVEAFQRLSEIEALNILQNNQQ